MATADDIGFKVLETDKEFTDSPESGQKECTCSRCGSLIPRNMSPILRCWPEPTKQNPDGTEFRYCWPCCKAAGIDFGELPPMEHFE